MERYSAKVLSKSLNQIVPLPTAHVVNILSNRVFKCLYFRPFKTKQDFLFRRFNVIEKLNAARTRAFGGLVQRLNKIMGIPSRENFP